MKRNKNIHQSAGTHELERLGFDEYDVDWQPPHPLGYLQRRPGAGSYEWHHAHGAFRRRIAFDELAVDMLKRGLLDARYTGPLDAFEDPVFPNNIALYQFSITSRFRALFRKSSKKPRAERPDS